MELDMAANLWHEKAEEAIDDDDFEYANECLLNEIGCLREALLNNDIDTEDKIEDILNSNRFIVDFSDLSISPVVIDNSIGYDYKSLLIPADSNFLVKNGFQINSKDIELYFSDNYQVDKFINILEKIKVYIKSKEKNK